MRILVLAACLGFLYPSIAAGKSEVASMVDRVEPITDGVRLDMRGFEAEIGFRRAPGALPRPARGKLAMEGRHLAAAAVVRGRLASRFTGIGGGVLSTSPYLDLADEGHGVFVRHTRSGHALAGGFLDSGDARLAAGETVLREAGLRLVLQGGYLREGEPGHGAARTGFAGAMVGAAAMRRLDVMLAWHEGRAFTDGEPPKPSRAFGAAAVWRQPFLRGGRVSLSLDRPLAEGGDGGPALGGRCTFPLALGRVKAAGTHRPGGATSIRFSYAMAW